MKSQMMRGAVLMVFCLAAFGSLAGCDQAEKALENTDLGVSAELTKLVGKAGELLGGIKDLDSAKAALPALKNLDGDLGSIVTKVKEMSPEQKSKLTAVVTKAMPQLEGAMEKISSLAGVGPVVGPTLESLTAKFKNLM